MSFSRDYQNKRKKDLIYISIAGIILFALAIFPFLYHEEIPRDDIFNSLQTIGQLDKYGNPLGSDYDLGKNGKFKNVMISVLHLYNGEGFDFELPIKALNEKGFVINKWSNEVPDINVFKEALQKSSQLWIISDRYTRLTDAHRDEIVNFFNEGKGLYLSGDNEPYYADINEISERLLGVKLTGNLPGSQVITKGLNKRHKVNFGINHLFEGVTISYIDNINKKLDVLLYSSENKPVIVAYQKNGKRLVIDGGFTRLFLKWDTAGTSRYVKNAAVWLTNVEKFGINKVMSRNKSKK